jgi:hypothetical protein
MRTIARTGMLLAALCLFTGCESLLSEWLAPSERVRIHDHRDDYWDICHPERESDMRGPFSRGPCD